jgi:hypothetical protein
VALTRTAHSPSHAAARRRRLAPAVVWGGAAWLLLRVIASAAAWASLHWIPQGTTVQVPGYSPPVLHGAAAVLAGAWLRADALWYLRIASAGYGGASGTYAFLPLFPELVRLFTPLLGGNGLYAALVVANASCLAGMIWLYGAVETLAGTRAARAAVVGLALLPTSFFLVAPYGEPVLLAAGAGALLAASRNRPLLAAAAGAAAALSRPFGVLIALPLAGFLLAGGRWRTVRWWVAPAGPVAGLVSWLAWSGAQLHDPLGALRVQAVWQRTLMLPWATLDAGVRAWLTWRRTSIGPYMLLDVLAVLFGIGIILAGTAVLRRRGSGWLAAGVAAYGIAVLAIPLSSPFLPRPLMSLPRFLLALFPLFGGYDLIRPRLRLPLAVLSAAGLAWLTALYVAARPIF